MPSVPDFEYTYRWADGLDVDALEARDQALEQHLAGGFGGGCSIDFEHPYRWDQILAATSIDEQLMLLEANMTALEQAVTGSGGCFLEFPFRWYNFWGELLAGESWAIGIAEENDRAIELLFGRCTCGGITIAATEFDAGVFGFFYPTNSHDLAGGPIVNPVILIDAFDFTNFQAGDNILLQYWDGSVFTTTLTYTPVGTGTETAVSHTITDTVVSVRWILDLDAGSEDTRALGDIRFTYDGAPSEELPWQFPS